MLDATGRLEGNLANVWGVLSAWTATLLFCCQPIAQLARNFASPETVSSLSVATVLLATTGNGMMVPRALFTKDLVWSVGSLWGSLAMGWGNMLCVVMAGSTAAGYGVASVQLSTHAVRLQTRIRFTAHSALIDVARAVLRMHVPAAQHLESAKRGMH